MITLSCVPITSFQPSTLALAGISHTTETTTAMVLLVVAVLGLGRALVHPFWGVRLRGVLGKLSPVLSLIVIAGFVLTAWLDAVSWKDSAPEEGEGALEASQARSLLDRAFAAAVDVPEYEYRERSYSAPLAKHEFIDREIELQYRHLLGTTQTGHDTLFHVLKGCKPAVVIGTLPLMIAIPLALMIGITAGFFGGRVDDLVVYLYSTLASIPGLLLMIALITALGRGLPQIAVGLGVTGWIGLCRLVRAETFKLRELEYVQAAVCLGTPTWKIITRHILPNLMHIVIITAILAFSGLVLTEAILSYLGIGLDHSWGAMIDNARGEVSREPAIWWNLVFSSMALFGLVLAMNILGDAIRDALDPRITAVE
jgi:peptide/nickel transport system permease protein